jgi:DNA-binding beta-propeller fold protein YncE
MKLSAVLFFALLAQAQSPFKLEKTIPLPGVEGRFDHLTADPQAKHVFLAALGNNTVEIVDIAAGKRVQSLTGMHEPQGIGFAPDVHRIYVANGKDGKLRIFDSVTFKPVTDVTIGEDADNVRYDAPRKQIWVAHGDGALQSMPTAGGKLLGDINLDAHPESFQLEKSGLRIFANVPDAGEIEVVDREKKTVLSKWAVKEAAANFPMALDESTHRLFAGCRKPAKVLVYDTESGKVVAQFAAPGDTDDVFFDSARKRLYVAGGEGFLEAFAQKSPNEYQSLGKIATASGARTGVYIPELNRFVIAVPHKGSQGAEARVYTVE